MSRQGEALERLEKAGCACRIVSANHFGDLREVLESLHREGKFDEEVYKEHYARFNYVLPKEAGFAKSIISVAVPVPAMTVTFVHDGKDIRALLPPTYADGAAINAFAKRTLKKVMKPGNYKFVWEPLAFKTLAVRSGLAKYGRNNITYVGKYGTFNRLTAFFTDYPCEEDQWQEPEALATCSKCTACIKACPTGAISGDRFLIKVERCLTCMNERPSERPFPGWVRPEWHNAIAGCMFCQNACPHNRQVIGWAEDKGRVSERDTDYLLKGKFEGERATRMNARLQKLGLDITMFPRNLQALLDNPKLDELQSSPYFLPDSVKRAR